MKLSPAGPFFAVGAWASDVKIWEVQTASNGAPSKAVQVFVQVQFRAVQGTVKGFRTAGPGPALL